jgi:hypothetical protein
MKGHGRNRRRCPIKQAEGLCSFNPSSASTSSVIEHEPESETDKRRAHRPVERLGNERPTQPARKRTRREGKQAKPEDTFRRMNGCKQHAEQSHRDSGGNKLRQECNVENPNFRIEKVC